MCSNDRLEIATPGGLPAGMRARIWGTRKRAPQPPAVRGIPPRGDGRAVRQRHQAHTPIMPRDYGVAEPLIEVFDNCVTTTFRRPAVQAEKDAGGNGSPIGANTKSAAGQDAA